jgi:hypothetical protein
MRQNINFYVFIWDNPSNISYGFKDKNGLNSFINRLKMDNVKVFFLHDAIPDYRDDDSYSLPHDGHPNSLANKKIAEYIYFHIK